MIILSSLVFIAVAIGKSNGFLSNTIGVASSTSRLYSYSPKDIRSSFAERISKSIDSVSQSLSAGVVIGALVSQVPTRAQAVDFNDVALPKLPYNYNDLEPYISEKTLRFHHDKHHAKYVSTTKDLITGTELEMSDLVTIMKASYKKNVALFNNAAQAWNHAFYWRCMSANGASQPTGKLAAQIDTTFGSFNDFKKVFAVAGATQFGSGWAWLVADEKGNLEVLKTTGAENPITAGKTPLLTMDIWEHAYYLDYQNARDKYIEAFLEHLVDWEFVQDRYTKRM